MAKNKSVYIFKMGMHKGVEIERVPKSYIKWFIESKTFSKIKKEDKLAVIEYYRIIEGLDEIKLVEKIKGTAEWHDISELPDIDSEVEVKPFTAILTFKGDYFINEKGKAVSVYLVDEWRYTDRYLKTIQ
jgi:hypothetical protein